MAVSRSEADDGGRKGTGSHKYEGAGPYYFLKGTKKGKPGAITIDFDSLPPIPPSVLEIIDPDDLKGIDPLDVKRAYYEELGFQITPETDGGQTSRLSHEEEIRQMRAEIKELGGNPDEVLLKPASQSQEATGVRIPIGARRQALAAMASVFLPLTTLFTRLFRHQPTPRK